MAIKQPNIDIAFKQKATSSIEKSERGIAILILKNDETSGCPDYAVYKEVTEYETVKDKYNAENQKAITDVFTFPPSKVIVVNSDTVSNALIEIEKNIPTGWITVENGTSEDFATLTSWTKSKEAKKRTYKAITYNTTSTDCKHIVNNTNPKVEFIDNRGKVDAIQYLPSLLGIAAYCGGNNRSMTYFKCTNLKSVEGFSDIDVELAKGNLVMFNDTDCVRICQGINTLITYDGETATEDMSFIETVEVMDMIQDDIRDVFKETYLGTYKNKLDNQILFISSINSSYFSELMDKDRLDPEYENVASINVETQRKAWIASGKTEANDWDDAKVKNSTFKRDIYLAGDVKILGSMTNLKFDISLF
ncbi:phage tail sheath C-terminal domain-containing protein [Clostridium butyricum]|uniref:phage tail sheath C-terminal domain-containing protein n=1 Tax=Clostridium butyricum TaxID=1492 RepID=UPI000903ED01|nr:phage tail sheath C-terminal domain-containing protein [Clostridium butyricum]APF23379.1 phage tail sheath family protein [Clostridium butyricum]